LPDPAFQHYSLQHIVLFGILNLGHCDLFEICDLGFVIFGFHKIKAVMEAGIR
jgi:hypothetical protein